MADLHANTSYQQNQVLTAGREHLLLLAYDGAIRFCRTAREYMKAGRLYEQHTNIVKAQAILWELIASIDRSVAPELGGRLEAVYHYLYDRLTHANTQDDVAALTGVIESLSDLRAAWAEAATRWRSEPAVPKLEVSR